MFNSEPIDPAKHEITVSETGKRTKQLTLDSVHATHAGEYTCIASNIAGSTSRSATLVVNGTYECVENMKWLCELQLIISYIRLSCIFLNNV